MEIQRIKLEEFSNSCLVKIGVPKQEAEIITNTMIEADARGIHSHGIMRLPIYIERIQKGLILKVANVSVENETNASAVLNGNFSAGQVVATKAMELAISKAKESSVGVVTVKNSNHFGIAAHYALKASEKNMIGIVMSNTSPLMPPIGGAEKVLGNNPLAISAPTETSFPLLLDMALSNVALGKILFAQTKGIPIPEGWGADREGNVTTDPSLVLNGGFVLPAAGPKGFGLALMIEILTGVLSGGDFSKMIPSMYDLTQKQSISHFMLVINVSDFMEIENFKKRISLLSSYVKDAVKASGVKELYLPGEIEFKIEADRMKSGIPISEGVWLELQKLGESLQVRSL